MADGGPQDAIGHALAKPKRAFGRSLADFRIEGAITPNGLHPAEERLLDCAERGEECEIASERPEAATPENRLRGPFLRFLLLGGDDNAPVHEKGVILHGAFIEGGIDLESAREVRSFLFWRCHIAEPLNGRNASFDDIKFLECRLGLLNFGSASISGDVFLNRSHVSGEARFSGAEIGGSFVCEGSKLKNEGGKALTCGSAKLTGNVLLRDGFVAEGEVCFVGADIGGFLECDNAKLNNARGMALTCERTHVIGSVFMRNGFEAEGEIRFLDAVIGGQIDCAGAKLRNTRAIVLGCDGAKVTGSVFLRNGFQSEGEVCFAGADIGGYLQCDGAKLKNPGGLALFCDTAKVTGTVFLSGGFEAEGEVRFPGASIGGQLVCNGAKLRNAGGTALRGDSAKVTGGAFLGDGFEAEGEVRFPGAEIAGQLNCNGAKLKNALVCDGAKVTGSVFLSGGFEAEGVRFAGAEILGDLGCAGGQFRYARAAKINDPQEGPWAGGALCFSSARIAGVLWLGPSAPPNDEQVKIQGSVNLQGAFAAQFVDAPESWPEDTVETEGGALPCHIHLDGFTYGRFVGVAKTDWRTRAAWLKRQRPSHLGEDFRPQPFEQLIKVLREMGHEADARRIGILKEEALQRRRKLQKEPLTWLFGWLFGWTCRYGYSSQRPFIFLVALWAICGGIYYVGAAHGGFAPKDAQVWTNAEYNAACDVNWTACGEVRGGKVSEIIAFNPFTYSADMLLPAIDLGQRSAWTPMWREIRFAVPHVAEVALPKWTLRAATWAENILGVSGLILIGAILSGIVKRD